MDCLTMTVEQAAEYSGIGLVSLRRMVRADRVPHFHIGEKESTTRIPVRALDDWLYQEAMGHIRYTPIGKDAA